VPANNSAELLKLAKSKPKELNYASSATAPYHMAGELFKAMAGVDIVHVPYKGSAGARTDAGRTGADDVRRSADNDRFHS
jgi:tripartite-type tricarboxylate transporter receptor subunit TctC